MMLKKQKILQWFLQHRIELVFLSVLLVIIALRGYWTPDEPDFAQSIKEMRQRGTWLFPWLNGEIYTEKPILFYWLIKSAAIGAEKLTGGLGFSRGIAPWALRIPSVLAATGMAFGLRAWARRFFGHRVAEVSILILITTPIWVWQSQFIQIDMLFAALVAWSWMCWISGYVLMRGVTSVRTKWEFRRWFLISYASIGLAVLAKGPLALVLSVAVVLSFLSWQRDWKALRQAEPFLGIFLLLVIVLPWYVIAGIKGGPHYAYAMIIRQNYSRAIEAWDHIQPWWRYLSYLAADFFPWSLLLPVIAFAAIRNRNSISIVHGFSLIAWLVPMILLSFSKSKQGKYFLMSYPFLATTVALGLHGFSRKTLQHLRHLTGLALGVPGIALILVSLTKLGGEKLQLQLRPVLGPICLLGLILLAGGLWIFHWGRSHKSRNNWIIQTALTLALAFTVVLPWTFICLDPIKDYRVWTRKTEVLLKGRRAYFWGDIRSGAMIYTDRLFPVLSNSSQLSMLQAGDCLVSTKRQWKVGIRGLDALTLKKFNIVYEQQQGGDGLFVLMINSDSNVSKSI